MDLITKKIKEIVCEYIEKENISLDESLFEVGIDSMNLLFIVNEIESCFSIVIPDGELLINNFETINQISDLVKKLAE